MIPMKPSRSFARSSSVPFPVHASLIKFETTSEGTDNFPSGTVSITFSKICVYVLNAIVEIDSLQINKSSLAPLDSTNTLMLSSFCIRIEKIVNPIFLLSVSSFLTSSSKISNTVLS
eukprot:TRINITY_DN964_c0_g1_i2.p2 TRINITY_DN964_c0_g1~~TRINITY_DN964_c0_g1_i2.p2  ORF type:complete len:117 (+),score=14.59 TRINITY_DN964_c0_g1_i2:47-397(+)